MHIILIFAKAALRRGTLIKHYMLPPHGLQILSALTPPQHSVRILDEYHRPAPLDLHADLVGISVWTAAAPRAYALADTYRQRGILVILGGPHVSVCPDEAAAHADAILVGEAETVWPTLLADLEAGRLRPLYEGPITSLDDSPRRTGPSSPLTTTPWRPPSPPPAAARAPAISAMKAAGPNPTSASARWITSWRRSTHAPARSPSSTTISPSTAATPATCSPPWKGAAAPGWA